jgi:antitoxin component YwqK of YwqJK toxin-antitoxin module
LAVVILFHSCKNESSPYKIICDDKENIKGIVKLSKSGNDTINISIRSNGDFNYLKTGSDEAGQTIWFSNKNTVDQIFNYKNGKKNGHFYSFYESGAIKEHRYLSNGKEILFGADYYNDSVGIIKSALHFNSMGELFYKKNFDSTGKFISEEGHKSKDR